MTRRLFRASAVQRYNERLEKIILPRYASPPWVLILWGFFGLQLAFTALLWTARMPVYASGPAVVVATSLAPADLRLANANEAVVAAFLPAEFAGQVAENQRARLHFGRPPAAGDDGSAEDSTTSVVAAVAPHAISPAAARSRYGLDDSTGLLVEGPVVVALIPLDGLTVALLGSSGEAQIEVGSQTGLALLPGIGRFFAAGSEVDDAR